MWMKADADVARKVNVIQATPQATVRQCIGWMSTARIMAVTDAPPKAARQVVITIRHMWSLRRRSAALVIIIALSRPRCFSSVGLGISLGQLTGFALVPHSPRPTGCGGCFHRKPLE